MTDIVERLRENAPMGETAVIRNLMYHAADEIERLREEIIKPRRPSADEMFALMNEINDLKKSLHKANGENSRILQRLRDERVSRTKEVLGDD